MLEKIEKKRLAILKVLNDSPKALSSDSIKKILKENGWDISSRTIRHYLVMFDRQGLTQPIGKRGRIITELGRKELLSSQVIERIGFLNTKIDRLTYHMNFNLEKREGTVIINLALLPYQQFIGGIDTFLKVYEKGYAMGQLIGVFGPGEEVCQKVIPSGFVGIATICSITLNGIFLSYGIPIVSRFSGLLEFVHGIPTRFVEIINYDGTTLDPLELFIRSRMTSCLELITSGKGQIGAGFREIPMEAKDEATEIMKKCQNALIGGLIMIGNPYQPFLNISVSVGRVGIAVVGGLNPIAALEERDRSTRVEFRALAGLLEYEQLFPVWKLKEKISSMKFSK